MNKDWRIIMHRLNHFIDHDFETCVGMHASHAAMANNVRYMLGFPWQQSSHPQIGFLDISAQSRIPRPMPMACRP